MLLQCYKYALSVAIISSFRPIILVIYCPREKGYCRKSNNWDQRSGQIRLNTLDSNTYAMQENCLKLCRAYEGATGCEVNWGGDNGCYVHTKEVSHGSGKDKRICWAFSKCREGNLI